MIFVNARVASGRYVSNINCGRSCHFSGGLSNRRNFNARRPYTRPFSPEGLPEGYQGHEDHDPRENAWVCCTVICFGLAITLGLVLLPLSLCCYSVIGAPVFLAGCIVVVCLVLLGIGLKTRQQKGCFTLRKPDFCSGGACGCSGRHQTTNEPFSETSPSGVERSISKLPFPQRKLD